LRVHAGLKLGEPSMRSCARAMSLRCPGEPIRRTELPSASPAAWILVSGPRENGQGPGHSAPFLPACAGGVVMRPNDGQIDHQPLQIGFARQGGENLVQNAHLDPAVIAPLDRCVVAKLFWEGLASEPPNEPSTRARSRTAGYPCWGPICLSALLARTLSAAPIDHPEARRSPKPTSKSQP
jgi:hypothetical protein